MYIYHCKIKGKTTEKFKKLAPSYIPSPTITVLACDFKEAIKKAYTYKNKAIQKVVGIISVQRKEKIDVI